jgi:phosphoglycolate phosphatase
MDTLFPGVAETLAILTASGVHLGLCSNKPEHLCRKVLSDTGLAPYFGSVVGGDTTSQPKPHRQPIDCALDALGSAAEFAILVGDSTVDQRAADAAKVPFVFFSHGYDDGVNVGAARWRVDALPEVLDIVRNS